MAINKKKVADDLDQMARREKSIADDGHRLGTAEKDLRDIHRLFWVGVLAAIAGLGTVYLTLDSRMDSLDRSVAVLEYQASEKTPHTAQ